MALLTSRHSSGDYYTAQVMTARGLAGEGYGPTPESAHFHAVADALRSDNPDYRTAGRGHVVWLDERGQRIFAQYL